MPNRAGAYTGEISGQMLAGLATWVIVGHSERRRDQNESDSLIARKIVRCGENGLRPILCVGEDLSERIAGRAEKTVREQLESTLEELARDGSSLPGDLVIAYEPVWAIGTGRTARGADAAAMAEVIRSALSTAGRTARRRCRCCTAAASPARRSASSSMSHPSTAPWSAAPA